MSDFTTVPNDKITKLKELANEIETLTWEYSTFKEDSKFYELQGKQNELFNLIKTI